MRSVVSAWPSSFTHSIGRSRDFCESGLPVLLGVPTHGALFTPDFSLLAAHVSDNRKNQPLSQIQRVHGPETLWSCMPHIFPSSFRATVQQCFRPLLGDGISAIHSTEECARNSRIRIVSPPRMTVSTTPSSKFRACRSCHSAL
jgi:hypothetical protein